MSTGTDIIEAALKKLGVHSQITPASPEHFVTAFKALNSMLSIWRSNGVDLGISYLTDPGDAMNEPLDVYNAIVTNLAARIGTDFGIPTTHERVSLEAARDYSDIDAIYRKHEVPNRTLSSTTPVGSGNRGYWDWGDGNWDEYFPEGTELDG